MQHHQVLCRHRDIRFQFGPPESFIPLLGNEVCPGFPYGLQNIVDNGRGKPGVQETTLSTLGPEGKGAPGGMMPGSIKCVRWRYGNSGLL
jgi:hypothetical protein